MKEIKMKRTLSILVAKERALLGSFNPTYEFLTFEVEISEDLKFKNLPELYDYFKPLVDKQINPKEDLKYNFQILSINEITNLLEPKPE